MKIVVTTHPRERVDERFCLMMQTAERMRRRAWQGYLDSTRATGSYNEVEPAAWARLQERLAGIDEELLQALAEHD
ncbi:MAG: hypothetical protein QOJ13_434 [Gaiellales bacterium]|jgi:hypothetical protein|nr:hypothetical protein [Gaiellales bacterium]MDX6591238.1 hypothetical protein [Gaiellales bacterium]